MTSRQFACKVCWQSFLCSGSSYIINGLLFCLCTSWKIQVNFQEESWWYRARVLTPKYQVKRYQTWSPHWWDARLCTRLEISVESNSVQTLQKSFGWDYQLRSPWYMHKYQICMFKILLLMSEFGELWKNQNNPACTKNVTVLIMLKLNAIQS